MSLISAMLISSEGLPRWLSDNEPTCQCRRCWRLGFNPLVGRIPWRRKWQPSPVFLPVIEHVYNIKKSSCLLCFASTCWFHSLMNLADRLLQPPLWIWWLPSLFFELCDSKRKGAFFLQLNLLKKKKREGKNSLSNACSQGIGALLSEWTWIKEAEFGDRQPHENYLAEWGRGSEAVLLGRHNDSCHQERKGGREKRVITKSHCPYELPRISSFNQPPSCLRSVWPSTLFHHLGLLRIVLFHACFHSTVIKIIPFHCLKYLSLETN